MKRILLALLLSINLFHPSVCGAVPPPIDMLPGVVEAWQSVEIASPVAGVIAEVAVEESQEVQAGTVLLRLDDRLARASVAAAAAVAQRDALIRRAELNVSLAEKYLARVRDAHRRRAASELELDEAEGRFVEAQAGLAQSHEQRAEAAAQLLLEQVRLAHHELRAPFSGRVLRVTSQAGDAVAPQKPLLQLTNLTRLRATLHVPVCYYGSLEVGASYALWCELPAPRAIDATLVVQEPVIDAATDTFRCVFEIDNHDLALPLGFAVRLCDPNATSPK
jgi:RND family efflux transporter MFP subunit